MGEAMQKHKDLVELAKICIEQAHLTKARGVAVELRRMAKEYQKRAAQMDADNVDEDSVN